MSFLEWWRRASEAVAGLTKMGLNSPFILGAWIIWNHRNRYVFDGKAPSVAAALAHAGDECQIWELAGAKGISFLTAPLPGV